MKAKEKLNALKEEILNKKPAELSEEETKHVTGGKNIGQSNDPLHIVDGQSNDPLFIVDG